MDLISRARAGERGSGRAAQAKLWHIKGLFTEDWL